MNYKFSVIILILLFFTAACSTQQQNEQGQLDKPLEEGLSWSIPTGTHWVTGNAQHVKGKYSITELVPKGETVQNWSELLSIQNFASKRGTPNDFLEALKIQREKTCPGSTNWNVIEMDEGSVLYEWKAKPCAGFPDQHEISRIIDGNWNRFRIAYTAKVGDIPEEKRNTLIQSMSKAEVNIKQ